MYTYTLLADELSPFQCGRTRNVARSDEPQERGNDGREGVFKINTVLCRKIENILKSAPSGRSLKVTPMCFAAQTVFQIKINRQFDVFFSASADEISPLVFNFLPLY